MPIQVGTSPALGSFGDFLDGPNRSFILDHGQWTFVDYPNATTTYLTDIAPNGMIVGWAVLLDRFIPFVYRGGEFSYAFDFHTGTLRWERELRHGAPVTPRYHKNSLATETPVTDGQRVYVFHAPAGLWAAVDVSGQIVWTRSIEQPALRLPLSRSAHALRR